MGMAHCGLDAVAVASAAAPFVASTVAADRAAAVSGLDMAQY